MIYFDRSKRLRALMLMAMFCSGAIAPLSDIRSATAREQDRVKACHKENLHLPQHSDVKTLDRLYQEYLGQSLPNVDLGMDQFQLARAIVHLDEAMNGQAKANQRKTLSSTDKFQLEQLKSRYSQAIARLETLDQERADRVLKTKSLNTQRYQGRPSPGAVGKVAPLVVPAPAPILPQPSIALDQLSGSSVSRPPVPEPSDRPSLPPNFNTEEYQRVSENPFFIPKQTPLSTFSIDVDTASYSNVRRFLKRGQMPPKDAVRLEEMINYFSYDYAKPKNDEPFSINTEVAKAPWNESHQLVQIGLKGKELETPKPSNLVFLVDVSGSMRAPRKLQLLQRSLCMMVREMKPDDHVTLVTYAGRAGLVLPPTSGREKTKILKAIDDLQAGGSTAGAAGINLAYDMAQKHFLRDGNNRVILATDGDFNVGVSSNAELERLIEEKRKSGIFLTVLGFGTGNYKDSKMETLANKGNGNYAYIDTLAEARKVLVEEITSTLFTIAKDVKIQVEFNPQHVQAYRLIGYENRLLRDQDFNDDQIDAGEIGAGHTVTALYEIIPTGISTDIELPTIDELKYQTPALGASQSPSSELMQVKLRYKQPQGEQSRLLTRTIDNQTQPKMSQNLEMASTVAMFGMYLRDSKYKGATSLNDLIERSERLQNKNSYRAEFASLLQKTQSIKGRM